MMRLLMTSLLSSELDDKWSSLPTQAADFDRDDLHRWPAHYGIVFRVRPKTAQIDVAVEQTAEELLVCDPDSIMESMPFRS